MRLVARVAPLLALVAGCGFAQKPYADDPLLRGGRAIWYAREAPPEVTEPPAPQLLPIEPPRAPTFPRWD